MATEESAAEVAARVSRLFVARKLSADPPAVEQLLDNSGAPTALGMRVSVDSPDLLPSGAVAEAFGVPENVRIWVEPSRGELAIRQEDDLVALIAGLLDETVVDIAVTYDYEVGMLIRKGGELTLHEDPLLWTEHRLALIRGTYRRESHWL
ncbi:SitI3 family protein [Kitasatospora griseola]|uniref:SitI3 family protein n=1 Tax=Kitasatospora griseola TaxID=2064 RepID=UPI003431240C